jgi:putative membrane protein
MMGYGAGLGFGLGGWLGMLGFVLLCVGVVAFVAWLFARAVATAQPAAPLASPRAAGPDPVEVLRLRFARGEISRDDYLAAKQTLEADR